MTLRIITQADIAAVKVNAVTVRAVLLHLVKHDALTEAQADELRRKLPRSNRPTGF